MRFRYQQLALFGTCAVAMVWMLFQPGSIVLLPEGCKLDANVGLMALNNATTLVSGFIVLRFFLWVSWGSERGERVLAAMWLSRDGVLKGPYSKFLTWLIHIDENGEDRDEF